jgi:cyclopropane-fatty-acyl-phospholipid synthase
MAKILTTATDMRILHLEDIGAHYAETVRLWRQRFLGKLDAMRTLGYEDEFLRLWNYYLCYCEGAFRERAIGNVQMHLVKPLARPAWP